MNKIKPDMKDIIIRPCKLCWIVGHCKNEPGAFHETVGYEFDYNLEIASGLTDLGDVFTFEPGNISFNKNYKYVIQKSMVPKTKDYDIGIELHFNSYSKEANGVEAWYWNGNEKGYKIASKYCSLMAKEFGSINRGPKAIKHDGQRGYWTFALQKPTIVLLEPFFCTGRENIKFDEPHEKIQYQNVLRKLAEYIQTEL